MDTDSNRTAGCEAVPPVGDTVALDEECSTVCYHPECACRERLFAGCSLPLAAVQITSTRPSGKGEER
jgi:hypothetical protein